MAKKHGGSVSMKRMPAARTSTKSLGIARIGRSPALVTVLKPATRPERERRDAIRAAVRSVVAIAEVE